MFKFLKDKLQNIFKTEEKVEKVVEKRKKTDKSKKPKKEETKKTPKAEKKTKLDKELEKVKAEEELVIIETEAEETIKEIEELEKEEEKVDEKIEELEDKEEIKKEEKKGFFDIFKRKKKEVEDIKTLEKEKEELEEELDELKDKKKEYEQEISEIKEDELGSEEIKEGREKKTGFFSKIQKGFNTIKLDKEIFDEIFEQLELAMIESNVALSVVDKIREDMKKSLLDIEIKKSDLEEEIKKTLKKSLEEILIEPFDIIEKINEKQGTFVILFFGINGAGKTTTIAKITHMLQKNNISCVLAAADTFRAASIEQLQKHAEKLQVKVIHQNYGSDPAAVAFDAIKYAQSNGIKVVLIDTAGRMHTKDNLLKEMEKIIRVTKPDLKIFVAESITGNDATEQARNFNETAGIDGTILSKADVDERGGSAISIGYVTGKPILFLGTGQEYDNLEVFSSKKVIERLGLD